MSRFGIGVRPQALLISQIYPITRFDSVGRFKRRLGMAKDEFSSADKESMNTGSGSKLCRSQLYLWVLDAIAPAHALTKNDIGQKLGEFYDSRKSQFQDNPELWKQKAVARFQQQALVEYGAIAHPKSNSNGYQGTPTTTGGNSKPYTANHADGVNFFNGCG